MSTTVNLINGLNLPRQILPLIKEHTRKKQFELAATLCVNDGQIPATPNLFSEFGRINSIWLDRPFDPRRKPIETGKCQYQSQSVTIHPATLSWRTSEHQLHALQLDSYHVPK